MKKREELLELRGIAKILDVLWENSANVRQMDKRILLELEHYFGENWMSDMYDFAGIKDARPEMPRPLKEIRNSAPQQTT